jgi:hypothetical protein
MREFIKGRCNAIFTNKNSGKPETVAVQLEGEQKTVLIPCSNFKELPMPGEVLEITPMCELRKRGNNYKVLPVANCKLVEYSDPVEEATTSEAPAF